jgi:hypothetical protein
VPHKINLFLDLAQLGLAKLKVLLDYLIKQICKEHNPDILDSYSPKLILQVCLVQAINLKLIKLMMMMMAYFLD